MSELATNDSITIQSLDIIPRLNRWTQSAILQDKAGGGDLSLRQLSALYVIQNESTTPGQLARRLMVTPAVVTGLIDRLERRGYVKRVSETGDRRRIHLELTEAGAEAGASVRADLMKLFACSLTALTDEERAALQGGLTVLHRVIADLESRGFSGKNHHN